MVNFKYYSSISDGWQFSFKSLKFSTLSALLSATYISLLGWFHYLYAAPHDRDLVAMASPTSWVLYCKRGLIFRSSSMTFPSLLAFQGLHGGSFLSHASWLQQLFETTDHSVVLLSSLHRQHSQVLLPA